MNIPFLCVALAFLLIYVPRPVVAAGQGKLGYDNRRPREQQARLEGVHARALAAHSNSFEAFAPFAAAVILAHLSGVPRDLASILAGAHVVLRGVYLWLYLADKPTARSAVWGLGTLATLGLFGLAVFR